MLSHSTNHCLTRLNNTQSFDSPLRLVIQLSGLFYQGSVSLHVNLSPSCGLFCYIQSIYKKEWKGWEKNWMTQKHTPSTTTFHSTYNMLSYLTKRYKKNTYSLLTKNHSTSIQHKYTQKKRVLHVNFTLPYILHKYMR